MGRHHPGFRERGVLSLLGLWATTASNVRSMSPRAAWAAQAYANTSSLKDLCAQASLERLVMLSVTDEERGYGIWIPPSVCTSGRASSAPIALALGCFGCTAHSVARPLFASAERFGFVLVAPEQYLRSWNAGECCGPALRERKPDAAFIATVLAHARRVLGVGADGGSGVYAFGWSNGGFMATQLAHTTTMLTAVAVVAGYTYEHLSAHLVGALNASLPRPTPILFFHARDDRIVKAAGCCEAEGGCCCGITSPQCVSIESAWSAWALANRCGINTSRLTPEPGLIAGHMGVRCVGRMHCAAETVACIAQRGGHSFGSRFFPFGGMVGAFFARTACIRGGGAWDEGEEACRCAGGRLADRSTAPYCRR